MNSTEKMEERLRRVDMHEVFLNRISLSIDKENYIEATWLIYSCIENRFFRTIEKYKEFCKHDSAKYKSNKNELALRTKINCVKRLLENDITCISESFTLELFENTKKWVAKRNEVMHNLVRLDIYENIDEIFKQLALEGKQLLDEIYKSCTLFREKFYAEDYVFKFPEQAMNACQCSPR